MRYDRPILIVTLSIIFGFAMIVLGESANGQPRPAVKVVESYRKAIPLVKTGFSVSALHVFGTSPGASDGADPQSSLFAGATGYFGTTTYGGVGAGVIYELIPPATNTSSWTEAVLHTFGTSPNATDGANPVGGLVGDSTGALYGTTKNGGSYGDGVLFKLSPPASGQSTWTESIVHNFSGGNDGANPLSNLTEDSSGGLYGTTQNGGSGGHGIAFRFVPPPTGQTAWTEYILHAFTGGADGANPSSGILLGHAAVYGTTAGGGTGHAGLAYVLVAPTFGSVWTETVMYTFGSQPNSVDGAFPLGGLIADSSGNLYGTTRAGGTKGFGTVYQLTPPNAAHSNWLQYTLHSFNGLGPNNTAGDGANPDATLALGSGGWIYGTTEHGGSPSCGSGCGTVFSLAPPPAGQTNWDETLEAISQPEGANPVSGVLLSNNLVFATTEYGGSGAGVAFVYAGWPTK